VLFNFPADNAMLNKHCIDCESELWKQLKHVSAVAYITIQILVLSVR
jgi:hypothetical protein